MKHAYPLLEADSDAPTIFHEQWWLDIATGGRFDIVEVRCNGKRVGWLPYFLRGRFGLKYSVPPRMTHALGPAIACAGAQAYAHSAVVRELIAQLPPAAIYHYTCHRDVTDVVAFQEHGFMTSAQFTQEISPQPADLLWANMRKKKRSQIRRAQDAVKVSTITDPDLFWRFYQTNLDARGLRNAYDGDQVRRSIEQCYLRRSGCIYAARNLTDNSLVGAIWCVWDRTAAYYFMSSRVQGAHDGAVSLLLWQAIQEASQRCLIFDFDGFTGAENIAFFSGFGGRLTPRYKVTRTTPLGRLVWEAKELRRANRRFC